MYKYIKRIKTKHYPWLAFFLTCITYLTAFSYMGLLPDGKYIIARSDLLQQYIPFIQLLEDVLKGKSSFWFSWNVNMGGNTALLHAYYTLSPFNIIFFLLGEKYIMHACVLVIVLKAGLAAFTCQIFLRKVLKQDGIRTVLFAMMYALCGFQVSYYFALSWMDALYSFPVIVLCITILVKKRRCMALTAAYAYLFYTNFYMGYMAGICSFFLFIAYSVHTYGINKFSIYAKLYFRYFCCVLSAVLLTCFIWYPTALGLMNNPSEYQDIFMTTYCNPLFVYNNLFMGEMQSLEGVTPFLYCGIPVLLLLPAYFCNRKIKIRERICAAIVVVWFVICILCLPFNRVMHAFDDPNMLRYRYAYCLTFVLIIIACRQSAFIKTISGRLMTVIVALNAAVYIASAYVYKQVYVRDFNANTLFGFIINFVFIGVWILLAAGYRRRKMDYVSFGIIAAILLMTELGINAGMSIKRMEHEPMLRAVYEEWHRLTEDVAKRMKEADNGWYRINAGHMLCKNTGAWYGFQGITNYPAAAANRYLMKGMDSLGFFTNDVVLCHAGMTPVTELLLGIKYEIDLGSTLSYIKDSETNKAVLPYAEKEKYLSAGYMVTDKIMDYHPETSPFANQNLLLSAMTGNDIRCFERIENVNLKIDNGILMQEKGAYYLKRKEEKAESVFHFFFPAVEGKEAFSYFWQTKNKYLDSTAKIKTNSCENENVTVALELYPARIVKLGLKEDQYALDILLADETESISFIDGYFVYYEANELKRAYENLKGNQMHNITIWKNGLSGEVNAEKEKNILFMSIPYAEGWRGFVDGREKEILPLADDTFIGMRIEPGKHSVKFIYEAPGVKEGRLVTFITAVILLLWIWRVIPLSNIRKEKGEEKNEERS